MNPAPCKYEAPRTRYQVLRTRCFELRSELRWPRYVVSCSAMAAGGTSTAHVEAPTRERRMGLTLGYARQNASRYCCSARVHPQRNCLRPTSRSFRNGAVLCPPIASGRYHSHHLAGEWRRGTAGDWVRGGMRAIPRGSRTLAFVLNIGPDGLRANAKTFDRVKDGQILGAVPEAVRVTAANNRLGWRIPSTETLRVRAVLSRLAAGNPSFANFTTPQFGQSQTAKTSQEVRQYR